MVRWSGWLLACISIIGVASCAMSPAPSRVGIGTNAASVLRSSGDFVQDKNFYLLTALAADPGVHATIAADPILADLGRRSSAALSAAYASCKPVAGCSLASMMYAEADIQIVADRLSAMAAPGGALNALVRRDLRPSGRFQQHAGLDDAAFIKAAWIETAAGVNRLYRVYDLGEAPRYPAIDAMSYKADSSEFQSLVKAVLETQIDGERPSDPFFADWLRVGLDLLVVNQRDEAGRYEPMDRGVNAAAFARARMIDWSERPYAAILVPGAGTLDGERGLSAAGALRVRLAARRYADKLAPFLIVSGGHVHPNKTPYAEAIEMKHELMDRYHVPESAILVDPHARHTTTNLRNGERLIHALGAPETTPILITTSRDQSLYIEGPVFARRNEDELGYQPLVVAKRLTPNDLVMTQNLTSLHADPRDPLDP
jgi:hypothetical protein